MKYLQILLSLLIAICTSHLALAGHHEEGEQVEPAFDTREAVAIDGEAESKAESDNDESSEATSSADHGSQESPYSIDY